MGKAKKTAPKTIKIRVHKSALQDIVEITNYIANTNQQPLNAIKISEAIEETITRIEQNPFAFKECEELPTKTKIYRQAVCSSWLIIYKITSTEIILLTVIHAGRRPSKRKLLRKLK